ncbi:helix-turn-helix domain-containing protein [Halorarius litoreus]|uniref:helix-turn-helix domain-containing protein n=1 Tax=Halorarius litoreus TaxID=2962676 RepID=UPI0020CE8D56|nr:helix-turn-helix domain-containing protein [Halorarius litoreus]
MPRAKLTLRIPEGVWIGDISRRHPDSTFRILSALPAEAGGVGLVEVESDGVEAVLAAFRANDEVTEAHCLHRADREALVQFETTNPLLLLPVQGSGVPLELPFEIREGKARWTVTAPHDRLSALGDQLTAFDIPFDVEVVSEVTPAESLLTETQRDLVERAVVAGYYDSPRTCSLTELAEQVDAAKSTVSETLHRAEGAVMKAYLDRE